MRMLRDPTESPSLGLSFLDSRRRIEMSLSLSCLVYRCLEPIVVGNDKLIEGRKR